MQLLVRGLDGRTCVVQVPGGADATVADLKALLEARTGVPAAEQLLTHGGRPLAPDAAGLGAAGLSRDSSLSLLLRLAGGKGGFGALLRGQGRDGKITDNFDACRDLSGRRIRHVEAEKKLKEWQSQAKERELEALALKHIKEMAKQAKQDRDFTINVEEVKRQHKEAADAVVDAVQTALAEGLQQQGAAAAAASGGGGGSSSGSGSSGSSSGSAGVAKRAAAAAAAGDGSGAVAAAAAAGSPSAKRKASGGAGPVAAAAGGAAAAKKRRTMLDLVEGDSSGSGSDSSEDEDEA